MPSNANTNNCLILESKASVKHIPPHLQIYYINSRRRFFVYFRHHKQMIEAMEIFNEVGAKYYRRCSLLPDREQYEEQLYHCNFMTKRVDLRKNIDPTTQVNEPRTHFQRFKPHQQEKQKQKPGLLDEHQMDIENKVSNILEPSNQPHEKSQQRQEEILQKVKEKMEETLVAAEPDQVKEREVINTPISPVICEQDAKAEIIQQMQVQAPPQEYQHARRLELSQQKFINIKAKAILQNKELLRRILASSN